MNIVGPGQSIPGFHQVPTSINVVTGGTVTGDVTDIQEWQDGNELIIQETAGAPALEIEINFTNIISIRRIILQAWYESALATHYFVADLTDYVSVSDKRIWSFARGFAMNNLYSDTPIDGQRFIDVGVNKGNAKMTLCHIPSGNTAHNLHIGYAALIT